MPGFLAPVPGYRDAHQPPTRDSAGAQGHAGTVGGGLSMTRLVEKHIGQVPSRFIAGIFSAGTGQ
jgi:hypothetical protein